MDKVEIAGYIVTTICLIAAGVIMAICKMPLWVAIGLPAANPLCWAIIAYYENMSKAPIKKHHKK